ncbi:MAG: nitronate monooxygenase [bacterium]|nr:nitronate monooxygenase [Candidatus Kapabacteria bacterium]
MQLQFPANHAVSYQTRLTLLFGIGYPIVQAGMVWTSGHRLASAASNAGALGLIGAGSMKPELLAEHIRACRLETSKPFGVNIPLIRGDVDRLIETTLNEGIRIVFTSAGNPALHIDKFKAAGATVVHVVASVKHALKAQNVGVDAVVAEGFEAGGHNGLDEITTLCLVPQVVDAVAIPVIAAGGIADGRGMAAALALGAEGVQVGTRFAATHESSSHAAYKQAVVDANDTSTLLTLKRLTPVRLIKNDFALRVSQAEASGATRDELRAMLDTKRERRGIFEGDVDEGELEAGQGAGLIHEIIGAADVVRRMIAEFDIACARLASIARNTNSE